MKNFINHLTNTYGFNGLYHFTDFTNLETILKTGYLYSRAYCKTNNMSFTDGAQKDIIQGTSDKVQNSVRFYFKEKSLTLKKNEGIREDFRDNPQSPHLPIPVYLIFKKDLLLDENIYFSNGNARANDTKFSYGNNLYFFKNYINWDAVFLDGYYDNGNRELKRQKQSEALSSKPVSLKYLDKIVFKSKADYNRFHSLYPNERFKTEVNKELFFNDHLSIEDYKIKVIDKNILLDLVFSKEIINPYDSDTFKIELLKNNKVIDKKQFGINEYNIKKIKIKPIFKNLKYYNPKDLLFRLYFFDIIIIEEYLLK